MVSFSLCRLPMTEQSDAVINQPKSLPLLLLLLPLHIPTVFSAVANHIHVYAGTTRHRTDILALQICLLSIYSIF